MRHRLLRGLAVTAALILVAPVAPAQAAARDVVSGNARFQVLSPTLIRTEFSPTGRFTDADTFNVIGRDDFKRTPFTSRVSRGWLTIETSGATLRYRVGSGPFNQDNLLVRVKNVTASPWTGGPVCTPGALCEAESLTLDGPSVATNHRDYTGRGFAAGFESTGASLKFAVTAAAAGARQLSVRYANSTGGDGQNVTRTLTVTVDGVAAGTLSLPPTADWDTWGLAAVPLTLSAGRHDVTLVRTATDSGNVNVDSLALVAPGAGYPAPTPPAAVPCVFAELCEAEKGQFSGRAKLADDHNGYAGEGFLAGLEGIGDGTAFTVTRVPADGVYQVQLRYANGPAGSQPLQTRTVTVGTATAELPPTSGWDFWRTQSVKLTLKAGTNTVALGCPTEQSCHVNVDTIAVTAARSKLLAPHAPLGGYRRGLDGVDGGARTYAGLLYQDGWSLLDDSGDHQDGYVFAYGTDYRRALRELSVLTGPTKLLPKWAYGVWYSQYFDRTAAEFDSIVARFKSEGVPLDVLVVDTDFKAPDKWNGWSVDESRFPDWNAFAANLHKKGIRTGLNIHPSISESDPHYARAQEIAKGKLKPSSRGRVFDFDDPDQLKAYFWLHEQMGADVDFWWLDWCCDDSRGSDARINQEYADRTGFAFSRAYGALQTGGYGNPGPVAGGPWADKRTTLHFTGDTISNWETLRYTIGYTPAESAATGLAAISHDIGGHTRGLQEPGAEPGSTKLPDDLYARWVQMGTFQPIDRLHSDHSDRLPWQYGPAANASAKKFLNLRKKLQPYTYAAAAEATRTGTPIVRAMYLAYPNEQEAYATAGSQYLFGPDFLVAPVTTPGTTASTTVWFPRGNTWVDYFTGKRYKGGTTATVTTTLDTMPVFVRSPGR
ncbi:TIM-barrel domain-containing protein [Actinoplanes derwentensis]|uniref:Carbohydrate binding module (Family 6) n=1 Tax=Actinoplanes derwentensis TaxID=113562 RepID=A0A1H1ZTX9_9ACTN|nr:TIM-barrel domain-containing protein [Actinoplanes derwentensis]GID83548.1 alpha-xylosidase [Actinoplanes derwentensis]SDT37164.1 Carbohydrate binding module (family 6) [Actinoplanes derwentensis]